MNDQLYLILTKLWKIGEGFSCSDAAYSMGFKEALSRACGCVGDLYNAEIEYQSWLEQIREDTP